jgi:hypothetical protein
MAERNVVELDYITHIFPIILVGNQLDAQFFL